MNRSLKKKKKREDKNLKATTSPILKKNAAGTFIFDIMQDSYFTDYDSPETIKSILNMQKLQEFSHILTNPYPFFFINNYLPLYEFLINFNDQEDQVYNYIFNFKKTEGELGNTNISAETEYMPFYLPFDSANFLTSLKNNSSSLITANNYVKIFKNPVFFTFFKKFSVKEAWLDNSNKELSKNSEDFFYYYFNRGFLSSFFRKNQLINKKKVFFENIFYFFSFFFFLKFFIFFFFSNNFFFFCLRFKLITKIINFSYFFFSKKFLYV